jgi:hypothetical protein
LRRREGCVVVKIVVDETGKAAGFEILGGPSEFHEPAKAAAGLSRFEPATLAGRKIPSVVISRFLFALEAGSPGSEPRR